MLIFILYGILNVLLQPCLESSQVSIKLASVILKIIDLFAHCKNCNISNKNFQKSQRRRIFVNKKF